MTQTDNLTEGLPARYRRRILPPEDLVALANTYSSAYKAGRAMGTGTETAQKLRDGTQKMRTGTIEMIRNNLKINKRETLESRLFYILHAPRSAAVFIKKIRAAATMVDDHIQHCPRNSVYKNFLFPPKRQLAQLATAMQAVARMLKEIHEKCPQYDELFFDHTELVKKFDAQNKDKKSKK